jgi:ubiquinone biosynthesis UbiH/UbiF/VisC/COQ6 family hydroxylase
MTVKRDDYQHRALVANFSCEFDHANCARQWFIEQDILALLPLPNQQVSMVWSSHQAEQLMQLDAEQLAQAVASASGMALGQLKLLAPAQTFALAKQSVQHSVAANIVLIGDAAHTVHPMAGQGVNLGLRDVAQLASCLQHKPTNIGDYLLLRQYERARKLDVLSMQGFTHGLYVLFQQQQTWLKKMRQWGMQLPNRWAWLKQQLVRQAIR